MGFDRTRGGRHQVPRARATDVSQRALAPAAAREMKSRPGKGFQDGIVFLLQDRPVIHRGDNKDHRDGEPGSREDGDNKHSRPSAAAGCGFGVFSRKPRMTISTPWQSYWERAQSWPTLSSRREMRRGRTCRMGKHQHCCRAQAINVARSTPRPHSPNPPQPRAELANRGEML